jgi:hypothetical protein
MRAMSDTWNVTITLAPPAGTGPVLLAGATSVLGWALDELDLEHDHYIEGTRADCAVIEMVNVVADDISEEDLTAKVATAVHDLIAQNLELAGWGVQVAATPPQAEDDEEDLDAEAAALVPDGETMTKNLLHAIAYEGSVYDAAKEFTAWDLGTLSPKDLDSLTAKEREEALQRATALAGCLMHSAVVVVDHLFEDIEAMRTARADKDPLDIDETWVLSRLPSRFADKYTPLFAQEFLVALVDVTARFTSGWTPLACVAQELGLRVLLDQVEIVAEAADVKLDDDWRNHLEELLFEDIDHELLYDMALDGIEDTPSLQPPGMAPMRFDDWFTPFNEDRHLPPYARAGGSKPSPNEPQRG